MSRLIDVDTLIAELMKHIWDDKKFSEIVKDVPTIHAIPVDKVKAAREEIQNSKGDSYEELAQFFYDEGLKYAVAVLDKLIAESEET